MKGISDFEVRRKRTFILFFLRRVVNGIQVGIFIPSMWSYLKSLDAKPMFLGVTNGLPLLATLFIIPVVGRLYDETLRCREILMVCSFTEIIGNIVYSLPFSRWIVLSGNVIIGLSQVGFVVVASEIPWITTKQERLGAFARVEAGLLFGLFTGPALSYVFRYVHVQIGAWPIDFRNAPAILLVFLILILLILTWVMVTNLARDVAYLAEDGEEIIEDADMVDQKNEIKGHIDEEASPDSEEEGAIMLDKEEQTRDLLDGGTISLIKVLKEEVFCSEILSIYFTFFVILTIGLGAEVLTPLIIKEDFKWQPTYISLMYVLQAVIAMACYIIMTKISKKASDVAFIAIGTLCVLGCAPLFIAMQVVRGNIGPMIALFFSAVLLATIGFAAAEVACRALLSKVTRLESQGIVQGGLLITRLLSNCLGSLFMAFTFDNFYKGAVTLIVFSTLALFWLLLSVRKLDKRQHLYKQG